MCTHLHYDGGVQDSNLAVLISAKGVTYGNESKGYRRVQEWRGRLEVGLPWLPELLGG